MLALFVLKVGPIFCVLVFFLFLKISFHLQKEEDFSKTNKKINRKKNKNVLKTGPMLLHNILGPVFNTTLDQFLTHLFFLFVGGLKPLFL